MTQPAYDVLSEKRRLESAGVPAGQAEAILESVTHATTVNEEWKRKLDHVQGSAASLKADVGTLKADVGALKTDVGALKADVSALKTDVSALKADVGALKTDVGALKTDVSALKADVGALKVGLASVKAEMATKKDVEAAVAVLRADMYRALWVQGLSLGTLILGLAVLVATAAVF